MRSAPACYEADVRARTVTEACWGRRRVPLARPYRLSFVTLDALDVVWVWLRFDHGPPGVGEAVALPGYGDETADQVAATVAALVADLGELEARAGAARARAPFAASAVLTALQLPDWLADGPPIPTNIAIGPGVPAPEGYQHVKVKVGPDLVGALRGGPHVVFDANQAYDVEGALECAHRIAAAGGARWFEQPVSRHDWEGMARVCAESPVPVLLDEAVCGAADIERARAIGAHGVKLKLCKVGGPDELEALARAARPLTVVQGNGVATDIGNLAEAMVARRLGDVLAAPCEGSGFARLAEPLLFPLTIRDGAIVTPDIRTIEEALWDAPRRLT